VRPHIDTRKAKIHIEHPEIITVPGSANYMQHRRLENAEELLDIDLWKGFDSLGRIVRMDALSVACCDLRGVSYVPLPLRSFFFLYWISL